MTSSCRLLLLAALAFGPACDCGGGGGKDMPAPIGEDGGTDSGMVDFPDAAPPVFIPPVNPDLIPGDPPEGLAMEACAVDTNKLFELTSSDGIVGDPMLAVDQIESRFGMVFVDTSEVCSDAVKMANLQGPAGSGEPEIEVILDTCSEIGQAVIAHNFDNWLLATIDNRQGAMDVWIQRGGDETGEQAFRLSETPQRETDLAIMAAPPIPTGATTDLGADGFAAVAWVEQISTATETSQSLVLQMLEVDGTPTGEPIVLYEHGPLEFTSLTLGRIGEDKLGIGYRRFDRMGLSEIVFEVRQGADGELLRAPWVLTGDGGRQGTIEIASDETGAGLAYSIEQGTEGRQIWFIRLDDNGEAAPVESGGRSGGPSEPQRIVGLPYKAVDASIAKLLRGYAVAFRALPGGPITESVIRIQFLDRFGRVIEQPSSVAYAAEEGGRTTIEAAFDGRISLGWTDATDDFMGTTVHMVRLPCVK